MAGGIATILVIVAMTFYGISQLVLAFSKTSLTYNNLSTSTPSNQSIEQLSSTPTTQSMMIAFRRDFDYNMTVSSGNVTTNLEECTHKHFEGMS